MLTRGAAPKDAPRVVNTPGTAANTSTATYNPFYTYQPDDILLLVVECAESSGMNPASVFPGTWAHLAGSPRPQGSNVTTVNVMWHRVTAASSASFSAGSPGNHQVGFIAVVRGCAPTGEPQSFAVGAGQAAAGTSFTLASGGSATTEANSLVFAAVAANLDTGTNQIQSLTNPSLPTLSQVQQTSAVAGNGGGVGLWAGVKSSPGPIDDFTGTRTTGAAVSGLMFAFPPA